MNHPIALWCVMCDFCQRALGPEGEPIVIGDKSKRALEAPRDELEALAVSHGWEDFPACPEEGDHTRVNRCPECAEKARR